MNKNLFYICAFFLAAFLVAFWWSGNSFKEGHAAARSIIKTENAPKAIGPYSQAVQAGKTLYLAGQVGIDPKSGKLVSDSLHHQVRQAMDNLKAVLEAADFAISEVVEVQVFMTNIDKFSKFNEIYKTYFAADPPARAVVEVAGLPLNAKVEIKMTAVKK